MEGMTLLSSNEQNLAWQKIMIIEIIIIIIIFYRQVGLIQDVRF